MSKNKSGKSLRIEGLKIGAKRQVSLVCSFALPETLDVEVNCEMRWAGEARRLLLLISAALKEKRGGNAPTRPLRDSLRDACKDGIYVCDKLYKFDDVICYFNGIGHSQQEVLNLIRYWVSSTLVPFCRDHEVEETLLSELMMLSDRDALGEISALEGAARPDYFATTRAIAFAKIEQEITGKCVFPERGPLMVERRADDAETLVFVTPPSYFPHGKLQIFGSLVLRFAVARVPGSDRLVLNVSGGRREWDLREETSEYAVKAHFFLPDEGRVHRVHFPRKAQKLNLAWDLPVYLDSYNALQTSISRSDIGKVFSNSASLYKLRKGPWRRMGRGMPPLDLSAAVQAIRPALENAGIKPLLPDEQRPNISDKLGFDGEGRMSFSSGDNLKAFLEYSAASWAPEQQDLFRRLEQEGTIESLLGYIGPVEGKKPKSDDKRQSGSSEITEKQLEKWKATAERFIDPKRNLAIISRSDEDRKMFDELSKHITWNLFARTFVYHLPPGVHGIMPPENKAKGSDTERHMQLRRNWAPLIEKMKQDRITDVLVVAPKEYDGKAEDPINKATAKFVFSQAGMNSQYLMPRTAQDIADEQGGSDYLQRSLSAIRDLCFGSRGVVITPDNLHERTVANGFDTQYVYGISLLQHNKTVNNRRSASLLVATRLDLRTGLVDAMAFDGGRSDVKWLPFHRVLQDVGKTPSQNILGKGKEQPVRQVNAALRKLLDSISSSDPNGIVFVDSRSGGLHQRWRWLQARNLRKPVFLDSEENSDPRWSGLNFVLVDAIDAAHILNGGDAREGFYTTSQTVATVAHDEDVGVFWYQAAPRDNVTLPLISCSVTDSNGREPLKGKIDYMMPRPIQIVIRAGNLTQQKSAFLLSLLVALRTTHLTYAHESTFPSPLFQHAKLKSDMCRLMTGDDGKLEFVIEIEGDDEE